MHTDERGPCLVCQAPDSAYFAGRGEGPYCIDHGIPIARGLTAIEQAERRKVLDARREQFHAKGRAYWAARGIPVGATVAGTLVSFLGPFGPVQRMRGVAKIGVGYSRGAYVLCGKERLDPDYFGLEMKQLTTTHGA